MANRFITLLLAGILAVVAFDGFEQLRERQRQTPAAQASTPGDTRGSVRAQDDGTPIPPVKVSVDPSE